MRTKKFGVGAALIVAAMAMGSIAAQAQEKQPDVTANADGSCVYHKPIGGGQREDIHIGNGATYHQNEQKGKKTGVIYIPDRTYLCKDGHFSRVTN